MAEKQIEANDVVNNPETYDAEGATAAATTPVRRQSDHQQTSSTDAATSCVDLLERRDLTAELQAGDDGRAVSDRAASTSRPTNILEASNDTKTRAPNDAEYQLDWEKLIAEDKVIQRQRYLNELQRTAIASRVSARRAAQNTQTSATKKVSEDTDKLEKEMSLLPLHEARRADAAKLRRQRSVRRRKERRLQRAAGENQDSADSQRSDTRRAKLL